MRPDAIHAQAEHLRVQLFELLQVVDKAGVLASANGAEIQRIKDQDDLAFPRKIGKLDFFLTLVLERELRSGLSYRYGHEASSNSNNGYQVLRARSAGAGSTFTLNAP